MGLKIEKKKIAASRIQSGDLHFSKNLLSANPTAL